MKPLNMIKQVRAILNEGCCSKIEMRALDRLTGTYYEVVPKAIQVQDETVTIYLEGEQE